MNTREQVIQIAAELRSIAQEWREDGYSNLAYTLDRKAAALRAAVEPIERERERAAIESDIFCDQAAWGSTPAYKGPEMNADSQAKIESDMRDSAANVCDRFTYSGFKQELLKFADRLAALPRAEETRWLSLEGAAMTDKAEFVVSDRDALIDQGLAVIRQDYSVENVESHSTQEYVQNAVHQLVDAGWRPLPKFDAGDAVEAAYQAWDHCTSSSKLVAMRAALQAAFPALVARCQELEERLKTWQEWYANALNDADDLRTARNKALAEVERLKGAK